MSIKINIKIQVGNSQQSLEPTPTIITQNTPYFTWILPPNIEQRRFNLRVKSRETSAEFVSGEVVSTQNYYQWPLGIPMTDAWLGLIHVELVISEDSTVGGNFEYTSGADDNYFVYDKIAENIFNTENVAYRWKSSTDINYGQIKSYNLIVAEDPTFPLSQTILDVNVPDLGSAYTTFQGIVQIDRKYYYKIRAFDGLDYSGWSITNGFFTISNSPPVIQILNIYVLNNDYGDVMVEFLKTDTNQEFASVRCMYTGGNQDVTEKKNCSLINNLNKVPNGKNTIVWRSSRDEKLIEASNYIIYMQAYDGISIGLEDNYGPFYMDNRRFGLPPGGFGAVDVEFPLTATFVKKIDKLYKPGHVYPVTGTIGNYKKEFQLGHLRIVTANLISYSIYEAGRNTKPGYKEEYPEEEKKNYIDYPADYTGQGISQTYDRFGNPIGNQAKLFEKLEDDGNAPVFTLNPDELESNGYPKFFWRGEWSDYDKRIGYVKHYHAEYAYQEEDPIYGYKNWEVVLENGKYKRKTVKDGLRGVATPNGNLIKVGVVTYVPISKVLSPQNNEHSFFNVTGNIFSGKWQHIVGLSGLNKESSPYWPTDQLPYDIVGLTRDKESPRCAGKMAKMIPHTYNPEKKHEYPLNGEFTSPYSYFLSKNMNIGQDSIGSDGNLKFVGNIGDHYLDYFSGYPLDENPGFAKRNNPTWRGDRGFKLKGNFTENEKLEALKIIYLQRVWDAYNTVHWQATLGYSTKIHLQYTEYSSETEHGNWHDAMTKDGEYDEDLFYYLIRPLSWYAYLDTINSGMFREGYDYKFRIRLIDPVTQTFSAWSYSNKFTISHGSINPANILGVEYDPWNKDVLITFRIDDTQGDLYDIIGMSYTEDGRTFHPIELKDVRGKKSYLESNMHGDSTDDIITYQIIWESSSYDLSQGDNYRVRIMVTNSALTEGVDMPNFAWWMWNNPILRNTDSDITQLYGKNQKYIWNEETNEWDEIDPPKLIPGTIQQNQLEIDTIKADPPPSGVYEYYQDGDDSKPIINPSGYNEWINTDIGGATRGELIYNYEEKNRIIVEEVIPKLYKKRDIAEINTRRDLIKQGYYSNNYIDNDPTKEVFRYRVESQPYDGTEYDDIYYNERFSVAFRLQIDFFDTFDSQDGEKPLRDLFYQSDGTLIQAGPATDEVLTNPNDGTTWQEHVYEPTKAEQIADPNAEGEVWSGQPVSDNGDVGGTSSGEGGIYTSDPNSFDKKGFGSYILPKELYPGERMGYYLNSSYPNMNDTLPDGISSFNYHYPWRISAYNKVDGIAREIPRELITEIEIIPEDNRAIIHYTVYSDENVTNIVHDVGYSSDYQHYGLKNWEYSIDTKTPEWEYKTNVQFITDRPRENGEVIPDDRLIVTHIPEGTDRIRPWAIITNDHQFYLWYSKKNIYGNHIIMQGMGKNPFDYGDYAQCFPFYPLEKLEDYGNASAYYAPTVVNVSNQYHLWCTGIRNSINQIYYTTSDKLFADWEQVQECNGLEGCYYPSVLYIDGVYHLWCGKVDGILSKIFYFTSTDGIIWNAQNNGNAVYELSDNINSPCVILNNNMFVMYFTETRAGGTIISSVLSSDGLTWTDYQEEIVDDENVSNPCVLIDRYKGNNVFRIYYNQTIDTEQRIRTAILNDRIWITGKISTLTGTQTVVSSKQGTDGYTYNLNLSGNGLEGLDENSDLRVRLSFHNELTTRKFRVQSNWVDYSNAEEFKCSVSPNGKFRYHEILKSLTY